MRGLLYNLSLQSVIASTRLTQHPSFLLVDFKDSLLPVGSLAPARFALVWFFFFLLSCKMWGFREFVGFRVKGERSARRSRTRRRLKGVEVQLPREEEERAAGGRKEDAELAFVVRARSKEVGDTMIPPLQSLVKYDNQVLVSTVKDKRVKDKGNKVRMHKEAAGVSECVCECGSS